MAQYDQEPIRRTDENESGSDQKSNTTEQGAATPVAQDRGVFHADKPVSTSEGAVPEVGTPKKKAGVTEKVKDVLHGVKDSITGQKKHDATSPTGTGPATSPTAAATHPTTHDQTTGTHPQKVGYMDKVKDFISGQKPGHTTTTEPGYVATGDQHTPSHKPEVGSPGKGGHGAHGGQTLGDHIQQDSYGTQAEGWPQPVRPSEAGQHHGNAPTPAGATYTDASGKPAESPKADDVKKEGLMAKMMEKLHPGTHKETPHQ